MMKKKWLFMLASLLLATGLAAGCNDDEDPAPPPEDPQEEEPSVEDPNEKAEDLEDLENEDGKRDSFGQEMEEELEGKDEN